MVRIWHNNRWWVHHNACADIGLHVVIIRQPERLCAQWHDGGMFQASQVPRCCRASLDVQNDVLEDRWPRSQHEGLGYEIAEERDELLRIIEKEDVVLEPGLLDFVVQKMASILKWYASVTGMSYIDVIKPWIEAQRVWLPPTRCSQVSNDIVSSIWHKSTKEFGTVFDIGRLYLRYMSELMLILGIVVPPANSRIAKNRIMNTSSGRIDVEIRSDPSMADIRVIRIDTVRVYISRISFGKNNASGTVVQEAFLKQVLTKTSVSLRMGKSLLYLARTRVWVTKEYIWYDYSIEAFGIEL